MEKRKGEKEETHIEVQETCVNLFEIVTWPQTQTSWAVCPPGEKGRNHDTIQHIRSSISFPFLTFSPTTPLLPNPLPPSIISFLLFAINFVSFRHLQFLALFCPAFLIHHLPSFLAFFYYSFSYIFFPFLLFPFLIFFSIIPLSLALTFPSCLLLLVQPLFLSTTH